MNPPIIYLERLSDVERLFHAIWSPTNRYYWAAGPSTDVDNEWRQVRSVMGDGARANYPCIHSNGACIRMWAYSHAQYSRRDFASGRMCAPVNSINHFVEHLARYRVSVARAQHA